MKLYHVKNVERLFGNCGRCNGGVSFIFSGKRINAKEEAETISPILKEFSEDVQYLEFECENTKDIPNLLDSVVFG